MDIRRRFYSIIIIVFLLVALLALYLSKDFLLSLLLSIFIAYILYPVYAYLIQITGKRRVASALSLAAVFILLIFIALILFITALNEASRFLESAEAIIQYSRELSIGLTQFSYRYLPDPAANYIGHLPSATLDWALPQLSVRLSSFMSNIPLLFTHAVLIVFFTYYILVDGKRLMRNTINYMPEKVIILKFISQLDEIYTTLFHVLFITAGIVGALGAVGFYLLGMPYPLLWGILMAFSEFVPILGPVTLIWPVAIYYALIGNYLMAAILVIFSTLILTIIPENVIRPRLAVKGARVHPIITILAFTAPLFVIGTYGVIIGPAVFGFLLAGYRTLSYVAEI
jgi:predicted PurR-regulated permease PerM